MTSHTFIALQRILRAHQQPPYSNCSIAARATVSSSIYIDVRMKLLIHCLNAWHVHYHHYFLLLLFGLILVFLFCFCYSNYIFWKELNVCRILKLNLSGTALCLFLCFDKQGGLFCGLCAGKRYLFESSGDYNVS